MASVWKKVTFPVVETAGVHYWNPYTLVTTDGSEIISAGAVTTSGYNPNGPDTVTNLALIYDWAGRFDHEYFFSTYTVTQTPFAYAIALPHNNGAVAFSSQQDISGNWHLFRDIITGSGHNTITQQIDQVVALPAGEIFEHVHASYRPNDATPTYMVAYDVYNSTTQLDTVYMQSYTTSTDAAIGAPSMIAQYTGVATAADIPAWRMGSGAGGYAIADEQVNATTHHYIHIESFNPDGSAGSASFNLRGNNTDVTDIHDIRWQQTTSAATPAATWYVLDDETTTTAQGERVELFIHNATLNTNLAVATNLSGHQRIGISVDQNVGTGVVFAGYGDASGETIKEYDLNGTLLGSISLTDGQLISISSMHDGRVLVTSLKTEADNVTTQQVFDIVDFRTAAVVRDNHTAPAGDYHFAGTMFNDSYIGSDAGMDQMAGAGGADKFGFDVGMLGNNPYDEILDYNQGNTGVYSAAEGDQVDISSIVSAAYNHGAGQPVSALVRVVEDASNTFARLSVDQDGAANGTNFQQIAKLDGLHAGDTVNAILDATLPAGSSVTVAPQVANDFNGDGHGDVLFSAATPTANVGVDYEWQMNDRSISHEGAVDVFDSTFSVQVTGDFNGDGMTDTLFENPTTGGVYEWLLNGTAITSQGAVDVGDASYHLLGSADFDGNGTSDLLWRNDPGFVYMWQMAGQTDTPVPVSALDPSWHVAGTGDFNGDGQADILLRNISGTSDNGAFFIWEMNGSTIQNEGGVERPGTDWVTLGTGDFDGDGRTDIAVRHVSNFQPGEAHGAVWVYLMNGTSIVSQGAVGIADAATWHLQTISDLNGDGKDDILFRNDAGSFYSWDMNGTSIQSEGPAGTEEGNFADPAFHVVTQHWDLV